jgi:hypothetical protein
VGSSFRSSSCNSSLRLDVSVFTAGVLHAKPIAGSAAGDVGFGVVAGVAVLVACLLAFARFLEAKPITATGDVGFRIVAEAAGEGVAVVVSCLVAFAGFSGQEVGTENFRGDRDAI